MHDSQAFLDQIDLLASSLEALYFVKTDLLRIAYLFRGIKKRSVF